MSPFRWFRGFKIRPRLEVLHWAAEAFGVNAYSSRASAWFLRGCTWGRPALGQRSFWAAEVVLRASLTRFLACRLMRVLLATSLPRFNVLLWATEASACVPTRLALLLCVLHFGW